MKRKNGNSIFEKTFGKIEGPSFNMIFSPRNWMEDYACSLVDRIDFTKRMDEEAKYRYALMQEGL